MLRMSGFVECRLQEFEVGDVVMLRNRFPLNLVHRKNPGMDTVEQLAVDGASAQLFDFGHSELDR